MEQTEQAFALDPLSKKCEESIQAFPKIVQVKLGPSVEK